MTEMAFVWMRAHLDVTKIQKIWQALKPFACYKNGTILLPYCPCIWDNFCMLEYCMDPEFMHCNRIKHMNVITKLN